MFILIEISKLSNTYLSNSNSYKISRKYFSYAYLFLASMLHLSDIMGRVPNHVLVGAIGEVIEKDAIRPFCHLANVFKIPEFFL